MKTTTSVDTVMQRRRDAARSALDLPLLVVTGLLLSLGLIMVASASMPSAARLVDAPFYFFNRQAIYALIGLAVAWTVLQVPMAVWEKLGYPLMVAALALLLAVLIPGIGKVVNGSARWIDLYVIRLQVSEPARLALLIYLAGYLVRHGPALHGRIAVLLNPLAILATAALLLLMEPDFGAAAVLTATALTMMFIAGVRLTPFVGLFTVTAAATVALIYSSPYRLERFTGFLNPWSDPFDSGFQLTQSLIAIGSGHWLGLGLGESIQKMFYLPEAHTDFLFAILAEELGLLGSVVVIGLFMVFVWRAMRIADVAAEGGRWFSAYLCYGIGVWVGLQAFVNIGVNMGLLPTKGLTLPFMSYGGSSLVVMCAMVGLLLRAQMENRRPALRERWRND